MFKVHYIVVLLIAISSGISIGASGQSGMMRRLPRPSGNSGGGAGKDSLQKRDALADSITITFRYLDSTRMQKFDSSITDYSVRTPIPWHHIYLGNIGNPSRSLIFTPLMKPGWDNGFHAFDTYNYTTEETRFFNTTRPYSEFNYQLASRREQVIQMLHTQNILPNWNAAFQYRLINSPGIFQNQSTNHNHYRFSSWYQSINRRYQNFVVIVGNKMQNSDNGGIKSDINYLDSTSFDSRNTIPTQLGVNAGSSLNFFNSDITTGTKYTNASYLFRQQYDIGQKDSIVTDSSVIPLFYPRLRLEHTIDYRTYNYRFTDQNADTTSFYKVNYGLDTVGRFFLQDYWKELVNDFSFYTFPDAKNSQQFFKAGASFNMLSGNFDSGRIHDSYYNFLVHGEYRNKTRNQKWDIEALGSFYISGLNAGDYHAYIRLKRLISKKIGYLETGFENVNRSPSSIYDSLSHTSFFLGNRIDLNKENITQIFASIFVPRLALKLSGNYYLISNYSYFADFKQPRQYAPLFNLLQLMAEKQFRLARKWNWRTWVVLQQKTGNAPLNVPLFLTRNQFAYDGNLGFKNLTISFGLELKYNTPYKALAYSPLLGQFINQQEKTISMRMPDIAAFMHFRIKTFTTYLRVENLNTLNPETGKFTRNNLVAPDYPFPGMQIRIGIYWNFIN